MLKNRLKKLRIEKGVMAKELAEYLNITYRQYQRYETGTTDPPISKIALLADYFNISIDYLIGRSDDPNRH